ncbi:MAG: DUF4249 domain-containing protein [Salinivirgaceae bacterium]|nr:DUF4249 domain-containing protein [Salinivirgaceae bacterium]
MKSKILTIGVLSAIFGTACTESIDIKLNEGENNRLVVVGQITNEPGPHSVRLTRSTSYFYNQPAPPELGASVTITDGVQTFVLLDEDNDGTYWTDSAACGVPGRTYTLDIRLKNGESYTAVDKMPISNRFDTIYYEYVNEEFGVTLPQYHYFFYASFTEQKGVEDCYMVYVYFNDSCYNSNFEDVKWAYDGIYDGSGVFEDILICDANEDSIPRRAEARFDLYTISPEYCKFINDISAETFDNATILQGPPANIYSNISNGALGFFCARSAAKPYRLRLE